MSCRVENLLSKGKSPSLRTTGWSSSQEQRISRANAALDLKSSVQFRPTLLWRVRAELTITKCCSRSREQRFCYETRLAMSGAAFSLKKHYLEGPEQCRAVLLLTLRRVSPREVANATTMSQPNSAYGVGARTKYPRRDTTPPREGTLDRSTAHAYQTRFQQTDRVATHKCFRAHIRDNFEPPREGTCHRPPCHSCYCLLQQTRCVLLLFFCQTNGPPQHEAAARVLMREAGKSLPEQVRRMNTCFVAGACLGRHAAPEDI